MDRDRHEQAGAATLARRVQSIACVSYLNARPLIEGLDRCSDALLKFDVPSRMLTLLEGGEVELALCPVIDYHRSATALQIVPAGGIGCRGATLTVRLYSRVPFPSISCVHADSDSHTSVALLRVILAHRYTTTPHVVAYRPPHGNREQAHQRSPLPESLLLIGDKVVTAPPADHRYVHQLDLGQAWYDMTGLPFVFAVWMTRPGTDLGMLPDTLSQLRIRNASHIDLIARRHAAAHGWPIELAQQYLGRHMQYEIRTPQLQAIERFSHMAGKLELIQRIRPLQIKN